MDLDNIRLTEIKKKKEDEMEDCPACFGEGYEDWGGEYENGECLVCSGTGKIKKEKENESTGKN